MSQKDVDTHSANEIRTYEFALTFMELVDVVRFFKATTVSYV